MENNYDRQAAQARQRFLTYDQQSLIRKLNLPRDEQFLYPTMLHTLYRIDRATGVIGRQTPRGWVGATYQETMTLLDLVCDSSPRRALAHKWKAMGDFGHLFHTTLLEGADPWAQLFEGNTAGFHRACQALGGKPFPQGDISYTIELFDGLPIALQLWFGDEEFPATLRFLWDENALQYLKYETMYFAKDLLLEMLKEKMA